MENLTNDQHLMSVSNKVSYHTRYGIDGCVYRQAITITKKQFVELNDRIISEANDHYENYANYTTTKSIMDAELYLKPLKMDDNRNVSTTLTQSKFVALILGIKLKSGKNTMLLVR